jgi:hypothetical protein
MLPYDVPSPTAHSHRQADSFMRSRQSVKDVPHVQTSFFDDRTFRVARVVEKEFGFELVKQRLNSLGPSSVSQPPNFPQPVRIAHPSGPPSLSTLFVRPSPSPLSVVASLVNTIAS